MGDISTWSSLLDEERGNDFAAALIYCGSPFSNVRGFDEWAPFEDEIAAIQRAAGSGGENLATARQPESDGSAQRQSLRV